VADLLQPARIVPMFAALVAVVVVAPFEWTLFTLPGPITVTSVEAVMGVALTVYALSVGRAGRSALPAISPLLTLTLAIFLGVLALAALATRFEQGNALRFVARITAATVLCALAMRAIDDGRRARQIAGVVVGTATVVAAIAVLEAMQWQVVLNALTTFRPGFHVVAGQLRATSTLFYPTIASMYLEVGFVLGLWLLLTTQSVKRIVSFAALVVIGGGISATFTRAGLFAMLVAIAIVAMVRVDARTGLRMASDRSSRRVLSALTLALIGVVLLAHSPELLAARMTTEGSDAWYGAHYEVPATLEMTTSGVLQVPVAVTNSGRLAWDSTVEPAFALSYHWLRDSDPLRGEVVEFEGQRTPFVSRVRPGDRIQLSADVIAPREPGTYTLAWDVVHETRAWLSTEGVAMGNVQPTVVHSRMARLPAATIRPSRPALWSAALALAGDHPLLGIGPDNYRLAYGQYLGTQQWDSRVHANSMYFEVLTGAGVLGLMSFLGLLSALAFTLWDRARAAAPEQQVAGSAAMALFVVIAGHGLVDSFLSFTTTYVMFAVAVGWALSPGLQEGASDAHRL
jgi:hypothetical protein